jgi:tetratricopeptide (TPR) repeat protein
MRSRCLCAASCVLIMVAGALAEGLPWRETLGRAEVLRQQHRLAEAEQILVALLAEAQRISPSDPSIGVALNNLGSVYEGQGKYLEAERSYQRSLLALERALGVNHPYLARTVLVNLSQVYMDTGQYDKAERLLGRALAIVRRSAPDPETLASVEDNLAAL